jgi:hypothetical protein
MTTSELPIDLNLEELTINPKSPLPSFIEVILLEKAGESGQKVLKSIIDAVASNANQYIQTRRRRYDGDDDNIGLSSILFVKKKIAFIISRLCTKYKLEVLLVITYLIEKNMLLRSSNATLSESLFGLKRSKIRGGKYLQPMNKSDSIKAALLLAIVPYIGEKAKEIYEREIEIERRYQNNSGNHQQNTFIARFKKLFIYIFPFLYMSSEGINTTYQFAYMLGKSVYYHPSLHVLNQVVRRYAISDLEQKEVIEDGKKDLAVTKLGSRSLQNSAIAGVMIAFLVGWIGQFRRHLRNRRRRLLTRHDLGMPYYYYSSRDVTNGDREGDIITIPPPLPATIENDLNVSSSLCPLCQEKRIHPVATTGGYVFCYRCICMYIRENGGKCPVTGMNCKESQLIRIYESTNAVSHQ